jgi:hypothetical protein
LVERPAFLVWSQGEAQVWVADDGMVMPARGDLPNAIVLDAAGSTALKPGDMLDPMLVVAIKELVQIQPEVRVYQYSDDYGLSFRNDYGWMIRLGNGQEIETKVTLVNAITDHLLTVSVEPAFVDVRYLEAPYYRE